MLTAIEIIVLIIGFLAVCISFFVGNNAKTEQISHVDVPNETKEQLRREMSDYLEGKKRTDDFGNRRISEPEKQ